MGPRFAFSNVDRWTLPRAGEPSYRSDMKSLRVNFFEDDAIALAGHRKPVAFLETELFNEQRPGEGDGATRTDNAASPALHCFRPRCGCSLGSGGRRRLLHGNRVQQC